MPATFPTPLIVVIPGQLITASLWNGEFNNLFVNLIPAGIDTYSNSDVQMQASTDPFPSGTSRPTSLAGEIERIRYILNLIIGQTFWYQHPSISLETLNTSTPVIPTGTVMPFYQAAAPTGWTAVTLNDKFFRVVTAGTTGGNAGGSGLTPSSALTLAHSHTVNSHIHDLANHTHDLANHTHTSAAHTHTVPRDGWGESLSTITGRLKTSNFSDGNQEHATADNTSGSTTPGITGSPSINTSGTPSTNTSGATSPGTDSKLTNTAFQYADFIIASKN